MLVATPGQTTAYSTLHNSGNNTTATTTTGPLAKKSTLTSSSSSTANTSTATAGTPKSLINNNNHNSSTSNTNNHHNQNHRNDNKNNNNTTTTSSTISSKELNSSSTATATATHSLKTENSTKQSTNFIQTLKDSVQKALISTTGNNSIKLQNCINSTTATTAAAAAATSIQNVTSSSSSSNANKTAPAAAAATQSSSTSSNSATVATTSSSLVRNKYSASSLSKLHTIAPTIIHRFPEDRQHASSTDSLQKEMCHFKPIRTVPTTPWKSGSKSRGSNSLRFPKANLATKKSEFILKSNCDVNNRKKKRQKPIPENIDDEDDNEDEQENKEYYGIYKPKPSSTFLSSTADTTNHHESAFVCLVAQMKNLVNIQSKNIIISGKDGRDSAVKQVAINMELTKTKNARTANRTAKANNAAAILANNLISNTPNKKTKTTTKEQPVKKMYQARQKQKQTTNKSILQATKVDIPKDLVKVTTRSTRFNLKQTLNATTTTTITPDLEDNVGIQKSPKSKNISKISPAGITKAKSRRKLGSAKSKINNIAQLASTVAKDKLQMTANNVRDQPDANQQQQQRVNKRKRKLNQEYDNEISPASVATPTSPPPPKLISSKTQGRSRKSTRISKDICDKYSTDININQITNSTSNKVRFSPPLTRSRLKHLNQHQQHQQPQGKLETEVKIKRRKI